jgi:ribosomal RNA assembly protein
VIRKLRMPEDRLPILIGSRGRTKLFLENKTRTKIYVEEEVTISGDAVDVMTAENVVKAIARGFSPQNAFDLLDENCTLGLMDLPKDKNTLKRVRSRLIGTNGKARRNLEMLTKTKISIYGRTVGIIGNYENVEMAEDAINRLIKGFSHRNVYVYLEHHQSDMKKSDIDG